MCVYSDQLRLGMKLNDILEREFGGGGYGVEQGLSANHIKALAKFVDKFTNSLAIS